jgi:hypothetical protein
MARIKTYAIDTLITDNDIVIGSDSDNLSQTKNYKASDLRGYVLSGLDPETGGNLKITTLTATSTEYLTPESYVNNLDPAIEVLNYEIMFLILNGRTYIFRKNGDTFGVDETQTTSIDFTEIDVTSIINANLQGLESVLNQDNEAPESDAKLNRVYLYDNYTDDSTYGVYLEGSKQSLNIYKSDGSLIGRVLLNGLLFRSGVHQFNLTVPAITASREVFFQDKAGTIAYLSDIPSVTVTDLVAGDNIAISETSPGVFTISALAIEDLLVTNTFLRDNITDTTYFSNGGNFTYDEELSPINSIVIRFNSEITKTNESIGVIYTTFENKVISTEINTSTNAVIDASNVIVNFNFASIWNDSPGSKILSIDICFYPDALENSDGFYFNGNIPLSISKYNVSW